MLVLLTLVLLIPTFVLGAAILWSRKMFWTGCIFFLCAFMLLTALEKAEHLSHSPEIEDEDNSAFSRGSQWSI